MFLKKNGFTLIETVVVILIMGIIAAIGVPLLLEATEAMSFLTVRPDLTQSADVALSRMSREIRRLRDDISISVATASQFAFYDIDNVLISYSRIGVNLMRNTLTTDILASNINSLIFTYYDDDGNVLANPTVGIGTLTNIRRIEITLVFQSGFSYSFRSQIRPPNLRHLSYKFS